MDSYISDESLEGWNPKVKFQVREVSLVNRGFCGVGEGLVAFQVPCDHDTANFDTFHELSDNLWSDKSSWSSAAEVLDAVHVPGEDQLPFLDCDEVEEFIRALEENDDAQELPEGLQPSQSQHDQFIQGYTTSSAAELSKPSTETISWAPVTPDASSSSPPTSPFQTVPQLSPATPTLDHPQGSRNSTPFNSSDLTPKTRRDLTRPTPKKSRQTKQERRKPIENQQLTSVPQDYQQCSRCPRWFETPKQLMWHVKRSHEVKEFQCGKCPKTFANKDRLDRHQMVHTGERPHACPQCPKSFLHGTTLKNHIRHKHTGERPYECSTCGKRFLQKSNLNQHTRLHTGFKAYGCEKCGKRFLQGSGLLLHSCPPGGVVEAEASEKI